MSLFRPHRGRSLGVLLLSGCLALAAIASCSGGTDFVEPAAPAHPSDSQFASPEEIATGKSVYLMRCVGCHAVDGSGIVGPDIRPDKVLEKYASAEAIEAIVRDGLGEMPEFASKLSDTEIDAVVAYVRGGQG